MDLIPPSQSPELAPFPGWPGHGGSVVGFVLAVAWPVSAMALWLCITLCSPVTVPDLLQPVLPCPGTGSVRQGEEEEEGTGAGAGDRTASPLFEPPGSS